MRRLPITMTAAMRGLAVLVLSLLLAATPVPAQDQAPPAGSGEAVSGEPLRNLIEVLRDDAAREALIGELETQLAEEEAPAGDGAPDLSAVAEEPVTLSGRIALMTQAASELAAETVAQSWTQITRLPQMFGALGRADYRLLSMRLFDLAVLAAVVYAAFLAARYVIETARRILKLPDPRKSWFAAVLAVVMLLVTNVMIVIAAWAIGHVVGIVFLGQAGRMPLHHSLFLNAFLVSELVSAVVRAVLAPRRPDLRLVGLSTEEARTLTIRARLVVMTLCYGQMLLVPVFNLYVSLGAGRAVSALAYLVGLALLVNFVLRIRPLVTGWLTSAAAADGRETTLDFMARNWHTPVLLYLLALFVVVLTRPEGELLAIVFATGQILLAVMVGVAVASLLNRLILSGVKLPGRVSESVPLLEQRLNAFVPKALVALRFLVVIAVGAFTLDTLGVFSVAGWLETGVGVRIATAVITVSLILFVAFAAWLTLNSWVDYRLHPRHGAAVSSRERTLLVLLRNAVTIAIFVLALMFTLSEVGINIAPLLASAGVIGLAVGFGAQRLVQDIITGVFIQLEGAIDVGDVVTIGGISGSVERLTIRSAGLRDAEGVYHIVPFSSVDTVSNFMRGFAFHICDMRIPYHQDVDKAAQAMSDAFDELKADPAVGRDVVGSFEWMGIERFGPSEVVLRARIKTNPGKQWGVGRAYNGIVKRIFDDRGIEIPFPHQTLYVRDGTTPAAAPDEPAPKATRRRRPAAGPEIPPSPDDTGQ